MIIATLTPNIEVKIEYLREQVFSKYSNDKAVFMDKDKNVIEVYWERQEAKPSVYCHCNGKIIHFGSLFQKFQKESPYKNIHMTYTKTGEDDNNKNVYYLSIEFDAYSKEQFDEIYDWVHGFLNKVFMVDIFIFPLE